MNMTNKKWIILACIICCCFFSLASCVNDILFPVAGTWQGTIKIPWPTTIWGSYSSSTYDIEMKINRSIFAREGTTYDLTGTVLSFEYTDDENLEITGEMTIEQFQETIEIVFEVDDETWTLRDGTFEGRMVMEGDVRLVSGSSSANGSFELNNTDRLF